MKHRNPYPGLTRLVDRHGKVRWRFRMKGRSACYIHGEYGSKIFEANYEKTVAGELVETVSVRHAVHGSMDWLAEQLIRTPDWQRQAKITRRNASYNLDRFRIAHGARMIREMRPQHVEAILAKMADRPAAANKLLKLIRRLCRLAIRRGVIGIDPTLGVKPYKMNPDGYHVWTDDEIKQFEKHHGVTSMAVRALRLSLYTGAARQDVAAIGRQNVRGSRIAYRRGKTGGEVDLPIMRDLSAVLALVPSDQMLFLTWGDGRPYKPESFGNWFRDQCIAAKLPHCSIPGLRKSGATRLANAGATEFEVMAYLGHKTPNEARTYTKKANRATLGNSGMAKLEIMSNQVTRLDKRRRKPLNSGGN